MRLLPLLALVLLAAAGCRTRPRFTEPLALAGGKSVPPEVLNDGYEAYTHYCYACHGEKGDGRGPSAPGMRPPPRDLTQGMFKFAGVPAGGLPHDEDLMALIKNGLDGTPMLPWDIPEPERRAIVQYIKTFSERWKNEEPAEKVKADAPDPWTGKEAEAIALGKKLYHLLGAEMKEGASEPTHIFAQCSGCHPSYLSKSEQTQLHSTVPGLPALEFREDLFRPLAKPTQFALGGKPLSILPPDFLFHRVKNGRTTESLYRTIAAGVGGTSMPAWKGAIKDADLWALAHYIKSLTDLRGTTAAVTLQAQLLAGQ